MVALRNVNNEDLWVHDDDVGITIVALKFGLTIAKGPRNGETARQHSDGPLGDWTTGASEHNVVILIHLAASFGDPLLLCLFGRLVVQGESFEH